ncbi:MAG TPA: 2-oxoglutarate and iron-dependent oxygenase domain-containing protein, partial [Bdellovibrionales bacterium]|nr:2-oxoglutarate and iron-dependent oxygenase domain-containing protein [Bdellovibrionales bacterium]
MLINYDRLSDPSENLKATLIGDGIFMLSPNPLPAVVRAQIGREHRLLFDLPEDKKRAHICALKSGRRGYIPFAVEQGQAHMAPDPKEGWHISREPRDSTENRRFYIENFWPKELQTFAPVFQSLYRDCDRISTELIRAIARSFGFAAYGESLAFEANGVLRLLRYRRRSQTALAAPHTDIGLFTLHLHRTGQPCEVFIDGKWRALEAPEDALVVLTGEMLMRVTSGLVRAPLHRVPEATEESYREFAGFFAHPNPQAILRSQCPDGPVQFRD